MLPVGLMGIGNPSGPGKDGGHQNVKESLPFIPKKVRFFVKMTVLKISPITKLAAEIECFFLFLCDVS